MKICRTYQTSKLIAALFACILVVSSAYTAPAFAQGISSGPTAARKENSSLFEGKPGKGAMGGSLGMPTGSAGNLGGSVGLASCQAERSQIAKLTELNRLLEEKVSELSKKTEKNQVAQKSGDMK